MYKVYEGQLVIFKKDLTPITLAVEGSRSKIADIVNEILRQNEETEFNNIQLMIREK